MLPARLGTDNNPVHIPIRQRTNTRAPFNTEYKYAIILRDFR